MALSKADLISLIREKLASGITISAKNHREVEEAIVENIFTLIDESNYNGATTGDIKEVSCSTAYIAENFETSGSNEGRGKLSGERYGWAICNGNQNNGAIIDKSGRVSIGTGNSAGWGNSGGINYTIGATGGASTHKLTINEMPEHTHTEIGPSDPGDHPGGVSGNDRPNGTKLNTTSPTGGSQSHNNMQPYIVTLFIQKIKTPYL